MKNLTLYESLFLLTIWRLKDNAYGVSIREKMSAITQRTLSHGALYSHLDQLFKKGYVSKTEGDPTPERGGRRKIYYRLSSKGITALKAAHKLQKTMWNDIPEFTLGKSKIS